MWTPRTWFCCASATQPPAICQPGTGARLPAPQVINARYGSLPAGACLSLDSGRVGCPVISARRHPPPRSSTCSWRNGALLLLLFLSLEQTSASLYRRVKEKPGKCPQERLTCDARVPDLCQTDYNCKKHMKCCAFACGKKCMDPYAEPCMLPVNRGKCKNKTTHWYFHSKHRICKTFIYQGCLGNANNFSKKEDCMKACSSTVKAGQCPLFPFKDRMRCSTSCRGDFDCPLKEKCCESMCGFDCAMAWTVKAGFCPNKPPTCSRIEKPMCLQDADCPSTAKCCSRCGLKCLDSLK
ncbi:WAP four-disulfide core domain protein 8 isoform X1 [Sus scrofa]|uniref:WAP four-disulfide core domain 8 n=2 Tax=Sus scrofa TaxID=9823 RepID=A0A8D1AXJ9_PIG|nr:WAP four-disulfide core domain protein 8 isoform X1 [Sus scrofa]